MTELNEQIWDRLRHERSRLIEDHQIDQLEAVWHKRLRERLDSENTYSK